MAKKPKEITAEKGAKTDPKPETIPNFCEITVSLLPLARSGVKRGESLGKHSSAALPRHCCVYHHANAGQPYPIADTAISRDQSIALATVACKTPELILVGITQNVRTRPVNLAQAEQLT
jgi:hypothetical protein